MTSSLLEDAPAERSIVFGPSADRTNIEGTAGLAFTISRSELSPGIASFGRVLRCSLFPVSSTSFFSSRCVSGLSLAVTGFISVSLKGLAFGVGCIVDSVWVGGSVAGVSVGFDCFQGILSFALSSASAFSSHALHASVCGLRPIQPV